jgi:hypothetical protein
VNNAFILGSSLSASRSNFTYVNNLSSQGNVYSTNLTASNNIYAGSIIYTGGRTAPDPTITMTGGLQIDGTNNTQFTISKNLSSSFAINVSETTPGTVNMYDYARGYWVNTLSLSGGNVNLASGNLGIGTSSPSAKLSVYGAGQTTAAISTVSNLGGSVYVQDSAGSSGNGGAIILGAQQGAFAAIKALITDGSINTVGELSFSTRNAVSDATLTERVRITATGTINTQGNPITNCPTTAKAWGGGSSAGVIEPLTFGVSTITRSGQGNYLVTMSTAINGYSIVATPNTSGGNQATAQVVSTTQFRVYTFGGAGAAADSAFKFAVFGV